MKKIKNKIKNNQKAIYIFVFFLLLSALADAASNSIIEVSQQVINCNNNGVCEASFGETTAACPDDCPAPPPPAEPAVVPASGGIFTTGIIPRIYEILVAASHNSAKIKWETTEPTLTTLNFGKTRDYELASFSETNFNAEHLISLFDLEPKTKYYFKMDFQSMTGARNRAENQEFTTPALPKLIPPEVIPEAPAEALPPELFPPKAPPEAPAEAPPSEAVPEAPAEAPEIPEFPPEEIPPLPEEEEEKKEEVRLFQTVRDIAAKFIFPYARAYAYAIAAIILLTILLIIILPFL